MLEDAELLRQYVATQSQDAFAELVRRRINLVYSVALRQVGGDTHLAEDVTQKVFAAFARKAGSLVGRPVLSGWLYRSAQFAASDVVRSERRRRAREQQNLVMHELNHPSEAPVDWEPARPLIDEAMADLNEADRDAIALRFFENRPFADIARALRLSEDTARKRVDRALDKMAAALSRRGVTSTSTALGVALVGQGLMAAPAGLAVSVAGSAAAGAVAASGWLSCLGSTAATAGAGAVAAVAIGVAAFEIHTAALREGEVQALAREEAGLQARVAGLEKELQSAQQRLAVSEQRGAAAEEDASRLLAAIQQSRNAPPARAAMAAMAPPGGTGEPLTHDTVQARYRRAQEMARSGDPAEALRELLWCFDTGMPPITGFGGVRMSFLLSDIARLGERFPPALAALRERRDAAEFRLRNSQTDYDATSTFAAINRVVNEQARTVAVFDELPEGDRRRQTLAMSAFDELLERRRYKDAALARTFVQMTQQFDRGAEERPLPAGVTDPERLRKAQRDYLVSSTAKHVEVLAGAGQVEQARTLASKLLGYDDSSETRVTLQRHAERAGQPDLLRGGPKS